MALLYLFPPLLEAVALQDVSYVGRLLLLEERSQADTTSWTQRLMLFGADFGVSYSSHSILSEDIFKI
jgi:hypothetical protein